jgi:hypothetical protein
VHYGEGKGHEIQKYIFIKVIKLLIRNSVEFHSHETEMSLEQNTNVDWLTSSRQEREKILKLNGREEMTLNFNTRVINNRQGKCF